VEAKLGNAEVFPVESGVEFPSECIPEIRIMLKRLFRVYAHIYHKHFNVVKEMDLTASLNSCFKHLVMFVVEFQLLYRDDVDSMKDLLVKWKFWEKMKSRKANNRKKQRSQSRPKKPLQIHTELPARQDSDIGTQSSLEKGQESPTSLTPRNSRSECSTPVVGRGRQNSLSVPDSEYIVVTDEMIDRAHRRPRGSVMRELPPPGMTQISLRGHPEGVHGAIVSTKHACEKKD